MTVYHPRSLDDVSGGTPGGVTIDGTTYSIADDGSVDCPSDLEDTVAEALADCYDVDVAAITDTVETLGGAVPDRTRDADVCGVTMSNGDECDRPAADCPYHGEG